MRDDEDAQAFVPVQTPQQRHTLRLIAEVEVGGGLVEDEKPRLLGEGPRENDALALASGEALEGLGGESLHPGEGHGLAGDALVLPALEEARGRVREAPHEDELLDGKRKSLGNVLRHHGDLPRHRCPAEGRHALAAHEDLASRGRSTWERRRMTVVFPAALGPMSPSTSPAATEKLSSRSSNGGRLAAPCG